MKRIFLISFLALSGIGFSQFNTGTGNISTGQKFQEIIQQIERNYVDPVNSKKLTETAIVAMLEELDQH